MNSRNTWQDQFIQLGAQGASRYQAAMAAGVAQITDLFASAERPYSGLDPMALQRRIRDIAFPDVPEQALSAVLKEVRDEIAAHAVIVQHPHCIAHLHTPVLLSGLVAEMFIAAQNLSMDSWDQSGAATFVEQRVVEHLTGLFGYPQGADGVFTSGGTQSNFMALLMARDNFLWRRHAHRVRADGLPAWASKLRIIASAKSHFTVDKAAIVMGLGQKAVVKVPTRDDGTMDADTLDSIVNGLLGDGLIPFAVVGTAGTTDHGAIDELTRIGDIARHHGLWFHVDAAYGGALIVSQSRHRLAGIELADSMTVDFHKMWFQPVSCGALLLRDGTRFQHLQYNAEYLNRETDDLPNLVDKTLSTTRRFDALKMYVTLRAVGTTMLGEMVDHLIQLAGLAAQRIQQHPDFELLAPAQLSTVLFRYAAARESNADRRDAFHRRLRALLLESGQAVLGETTVQGQVALKLTILNPCLGPADIDALLGKVANAASLLRQS